MNTTKEYVLGTDQVELDRLRLQHNLWKDHLIRFWQKAEIKPGQSILELGCGPGFTTQDLAEFTKNQSQITAVDISENFLAHLKSMNLPKVDVKKNYIETLELSKVDFDYAFCRWLMIFIPDIQKAIQKIRGHLKDQGRFCMQEYISYDSFSLAPDRPIMKKVVDAIFKSWMDQGGYPNQGRRLPEVLEKNGFKVLEIEPLARVCRPQDPLWAWPESFFQSFIPRLVENNYLTEVDQKDFFENWNQAKQSPGQFCVTPTVVNIIAEKR